MFNQCLKCRYSTLIDSTLKNKTCIFHYVTAYNRHCGWIDGWGVEQNAGISGQHCELKQNIYIGKSQGFFFFLLSLHQDTSKHSGTHSEPEPKTKCFHVRCLKEEKCGGKDKLDCPGSKQNTVVYGLTPCDHLVLKCLCELQTHTGDTETCLVFVTSKILKSDVIFYTMHNFWRCNYSFNKNKVLL